MGYIMTNTAIPTPIKNILTSQPIAIPVFHEVAIKLLQMMNGNFYKIEEVIILVHEDQALASEMLKCANSTYYSGQTPISTIKNAILRLGSQQIVNLAFSASMSNTKSDNALINAHMKNLWSHCRAVAKTSAYLALEVSHDKKIPELNHDEVYLAGLLHDIGKLYLLKVIDSLMMSDTIHPDNSLIEDILVELNTQQGVKVMKHYNIPDIYSDLLDRLIRDNWKCGSNDHFVATVRLADKMHYCREHDIDITDSIDACDISDEMSFLDMNDVSELNNLVNIIIE
ncbi:MAG: HDOD domain-containing protein [Oryzomonas sp.]|uniref:HDOD domain-containing protein n=1 Tax=Oryzomonas sp. TaxID=2855186 RepID=UPI00284CE68C|nr:HDOD domain-containing protein [Oryzomonas sp.]MDR3580460.1 HDOD domain-containing protein [Oryzomonas sp.]